MTELTARAQVDAIVALEGLRLPPDEYERLVAIYDETRTLLEPLRAPEFAYTEPAIVFPAKSRSDR